MPPYTPRDELFGRIGAVIAFIMVVVWVYLHYFHPEFGL